MNRSLDTGIRKWGAGGGTNVSTDYQYPLIFVVFRNLCSFKDSVTNDNNKQNKHRYWLT